jgi:hypothetical protein
MTATLSFHPPRTRLAAAAAALVLALPVAAQQLRHERMTDLNDTLPFGESEVTALGALPDGHLLVACGGAQAHLLSVHPTNGTVRLLRSWKEAPFAHSLVVRGDRFWLAVGGDPGAIVPDDAGAPGERLVAGRYANGRVTLAEHVAPTSGVGIATLAADAAGSRLFLVGRPTPVLYSFDPATAVYRELAVLGKRQNFEDATIWKGIPERVAEVPQALAVLGADDVCGFYKGTAFRWTEPPEPATGKRPASGLRIDRAPRVPAAQGRQGTEGDRAECLLVSRSGAVFGGSFDGYLFRYDPGTNRVVNLGKPFRQAGLRALAELPDGTLAGLCGEPRFRNRLFLYDPERGFREVAFKTNKMVLPYDIFSALAVLPDGGLCLGTRGRMTALLYGQLAD